MDVHHWSAGENHRAGSR